LVEWDADIYYWDKKTGERTVLEMQNEIHIPESSIRTKGKPRYKRAILKDDIETLRQKLIEDFKQISNQKQYIKLRGSLIYKEFFNAINKRFGVE
jgi:hypothetical protein